jgi:hypothetical protein
MFKILKYIKNQFLLNRRLTEEEERQKKEGYWIKRTQEGNEAYTFYCEDKKEIPIIVEFTWLNDVILNTNSFRKWRFPKVEELTPLEYEKVQNRLVRYFSCWGGDVKLDDSPFDWDKRY